MNEKLDLCLNDLSLVPFYDNAVLCKLRSVSCANDQNTVSAEHTSIAMNEYKTIKKKTNS